MDKPDQVTVTTSNLSANASIQEYLANRPEAKAARVYAEKREHLERESKFEPFTILNFNPIPLTQDGGITNVIPSFRDEGRRISRFVYKHLGFQAVATVTNIVEPLIFPWIKSTEQVDGAVIPICQPTSCNPIEIAHSFWKAYSNPGWILEEAYPGGVVVFQGKGEFLNDTRNVDFEIDIPVEHRSSAGFTYSTGRYPFHLSVFEALSKQRSYCKYVSKICDVLFQNEETRSQIHNIHRVWNQYELKMGWRSSPAPWYMPKDDHESEDED